MKWCEQNAKGIGELSMDEEELAAIAGHSASKVIAFSDDPQLFAISRLFLQIPWEYGFSGIVGKRYDAIKDFLRWNGFEVKKWTPILVQMGQTWASVADQ